ncbi:MAG TPA: hypothetical protein VH853_17540 [Polyangia bacterium]|nr:hypothetical protein [Polyangia bacterium]
MSGAPHHTDELVGRDRLDEIPKGSVFDGVNRAVEIGLAGQEDEGDIQILLADRPQQSPSVDIGHSEIADDGIEGTRLHDFYGLASAARNDDLESLSRKNPLGRPSDGRLVVDDENGG